jgi:hypothetical protein
MGRNLSPCLLLTYLSDANAKRLSRQEQTMVNLIYKCGEHQCEVIPPSVDTSAEGAFNYGGFSIADAEHLRGAAIRVRGMIRHTFREIVEAGIELRAAKITIGHGKFGA